jgi:hypothetical protein
MAIQAKLFVVEGATDAQISLKLPTIVGRSGQATLKVRTSVVSREHCRLFEKNGSLFVEDLHSSNGTFVNEEKITEATKMATGDFLKVGPVTLEVFCEVEDRQLSHDPYTGACGVLNDLPQEDAESPSNVHYKETIGGGFLGIDDSMLPVLESRAATAKSADAEFEQMKLGDAEETKPPRKSQKGRLLKKKQPTKKGGVEVEGETLDDFLNKMT